MVDQTEYQIVYIDDDGDSTEAAFNELKKARSDVKRMQKMGFRVKDTMMIKDGREAGPFEV